MTDRERWIVYPLLLLALGTSLRMKMFGTEQLHVDRLLDAEQVSCKRLVLLNDKDQPMLVMAPSNNGAYGVIEGTPLLIPHLRSEEIGIVDRKQQRVMTLDAAYTKQDGKLAGGRIIVYDAHNKPQVVLAKSPVGGTLSALDNHGKEVVIGHVQPRPGVRWSGMFTIASDGKTLKPLGSKFDQSVEHEKEPEKPNAKSGKPDDESGKPDDESGKPKAESRKPDEADGEDQ